LAEFLPHSQPLNFALLADEGIQDYPGANPLLQLQIHWHNHQQVCRTTGLMPDQAWDKARQEKRSCLRPVPPVSLLDLQRRLNPDSTVDFLGQNWTVTPSRSKIVTVVHHPHRCFWGVPQPPDPNHPIWPNVLASYRL